MCFDIIKVNKNFAVSSEMRLIQVVMRQLYIYWVSSQRGLMASFVKFGAKELNSWLLDINADNHEHVDAMHLYTLEIG
jgi:hypothetical protein